MFDWDNSGPSPEALKAFEEIKDDTKDFPQTTLGRHGSLPIGFGRALKTTRRSSSTLRLLEISKA
jgi:hypothetical protein